MTEKIYTVGQISVYIKNMFRNDYLLKKITISGEISNLKYHSSGHIYFSLKDKDAVLDAVMFRSSAASLKFRLTEGLKVNKFVQNKPDKNKQQVKIDIRLFNGQVITTNFNSNQTVKDIKNFVERKTINIYFTIS